MMENVVTEAPRDSRATRRLLRDALLAAVAFFLLAAALDPVFGPVFRKKGLFFHGIGSQGEYHRTWQLKHGWADATPMALEKVQTVRFNPDGTSEATYATTYAYTGQDRAAVLGKLSGNFEVTRVETVDGTPLEWNQKEEKGAKTLEITLAPGTDRFVVRGTFAVSGAFTSKGGRWSYEFGHLYGTPIAYRHVLYLPPGARIVKVHPKPPRITESAQATVLEYEQELGTDLWGNAESFECHMVFTLSPSDKPIKRPT